MSDLIPNITVPNDQWLDLNTASGVPVGNMMELINRGSYNILIEEASSQPSANSIGSASITPINGFQSSCTVVVGSDIIWVRSSSNYDGLISVQEI